MPTRSATRAAASLTAVLALGACATSPPADTASRADAESGPGFRPDLFIPRPEDAPSPMPVPAPPGRVWYAIADAFQDMELPIGYVDEDRRAVGVEGIRLRRIGGERPSALVDCGRGMTAAEVSDTYDVTLSYETVLRPGPDGTTLVDTDVEASAKPRAVSGHAVRCTSTGVLERMIGLRLADVAARLGG